jgi:hypothetical protein
MPYAIEYLPFLMGYTCVIGRCSRRTRMIACLSAGVACAAWSGELNAGWVASLLAISADTLSAAAGYLTAKFVQRAFVSREG